MGLGEDGLGRHGSFDELVRRRVARIKALQWRLEGVRSIDFTTEELAVVAVLKGVSQLNQNPYSLTDEELGAVELRLVEIEMKK